MNIMKRYILILAAMFLALRAGAQITLTQEQQDSLFEALLKQVMVDPDSADTRFRHSIHTITRTYGDSIAVRWAPDDYASWYVMNGCGYVIKRICYDDSGQDADTLAIVMPATLEEFERFAQNDTLAAAAAQVLYGESTILNGAEVLPGSADELMMVYDDQQNIYGMAMMIAELRADIAQAMGLMYIDRDVKPGLQYDYVVSPNVHDSIYPVRAFMAGGKVNEPYKKETFPFAPVDSVIDETSILLKWPYTEHSAYDIERRRVSSDTINILRRDDNRWEKLNAFPYISFEQAGGDGRSDRIYVDTPREPGIYEYRLRGYDSFGDCTLPGASCTVALRDVTPPAAPRIRHIEILRPDDGVYAEISWRLESKDDDLAGLIPMYYHPMLNEWIPMVEQMLLPTDTLFTANVSGLETSEITVAAVDTAQNISYGLPQMIRIADLVPPAPPTNVRSVISPEGVVMLAWSPSESTDVSHYHVYEANDTLHRFLPVPDVYQLRDTFYIDTLDTHLADLFHYYMVRAVDWSGNVSEFTPIHERYRPNFIQPSTCIIDSLWQDDNGIYMDWTTAPEEDIALYRVFRRLGTEGQWTLVGRFEKGEWTEPTLHVEDHPEYNQTQRYYYAVEGINMSGVSSGLSMQVSFRHRGPLVMDVPIKLDGTYREDYGCVVLAWSHDTLPSADPHHFIIYKTEDMEDDDSFKPFVTASADERDTYDYRLQQEHSARYFVMILYEDGRRTTASDVITVTRPKARQLDDKEKERLKKQRKENGTGRLNDL